MFLLKFLRVWNIIVTVLLGIFLIFTAYIVHRLNPTPVDVIAVALSFLAIVMSLLTAITLASVVESLIKSHIKSKGE